MSLTARDYQSAIDVQCAVNLSGVLKSAYEAACAIRTDLASMPGLGHSTADVNRHPIMVMYAAAIVELAGAGIADSDRYHVAYQMCKAAVEYLSAMAAEPASADLS